MSDSYKTELVLVNRATGVAETRAQIDTITKSVAQLAREDALYAQKQAQYSRQREASLRRESAAAQKLAQDMAKAEEKALARRSVFGVDTGVDIKNFAAGLYTVQAAYRAVAQAAGIAMDAVNEAAKWQKYEVAITTMEGSATVAKQSLQDLYEIAKAPGIDLEGANKSYLQLRAIGLEGERAKTIISEFANTVARSGGGGVEFERVNRQLVQMLANGRVLESELKWMKESMPELAKVMQATFGTTSAEGIRNMGVAADEFVSRLTDAFAKLPRAEATLSTSLENMSTAWSRFQASLVNTPATQKILDFITRMLELPVQADEANARMTANAKRVLGDLYSSTLAQTADPNREIARNSIAASAAGGADNAARYGGRMDALAAETKYYQDLAKARKDAADRQRDAALAEVDTAYRKETLNGKLQEETEWYERLKKALEGNRAALAKLNVVHAARIKAIQDKANKDAGAVVNVDYWTATKQSPAEMQYYWNTMRGGTGKENTELAQEKKAALEEAAAIVRTEQEQEYEEARLWREKALAAVRDDKESRLRVEEAYGKKLADINDKYNKQIAEEEKKRQKERLDAMESFTSGMGSLAGAMGGLILQMNDQNTEAYATMVAIQQGFAIAQATINMYVAMSKALASGLTTVDGLAQMGVVAAAGGQIISAIAAMNVAKVGKGAFDRGGSLGYGEWGIAGEYGPEIVQGPARITSRRETAAILNGSTGQAGTVVNVHNYSGASVATKTNSDGSIDLIIDKLEERMAEGVYSGAGKLGTSMSRTFGLRRVGR